MNNITGKTACERFGEDISQFRINKNCQTLKNIPNHILKIGAMYSSDNPSLQAFDPNLIPSYDQIKEFGCNGIWIYLAPGRQDTDDYRSTSSFFKRAELYLYQLKTIFSKFKSQSDKNFITIIEIEGLIFSQPLMNALNIIQDVVDFVIVNCILSKTYYSNVVDTFKKGLTYDNNKLVMIIYDTEWNGSEELTVWNEGNASQKVNALSKFESDAQTTRGGIIRECSEWPEEELIGGSISRQNLWEKRGRYDSSTAKCTFDLNDASPGRCLNTSDSCSSTKDCCNGQTNCDDFCNRYFPYAKSRE